MKKNNKNAFTLSETMIVLIVLGVVASLTIPALVRRQIEAAERAKIKKSMTVYDYVFNKMVTENDIKSNPELQTFAPLNDCTNTAPYFKGVENKDNNICKFKTSDGVWWNISDITHPNISLNKDDLDNPNSKKTFTMLGHFDNNGSVRVDDLSYEKNNSDLKKLFAFVNDEKEETVSAYDKFKSGLYDSPCSAENGNKNCYEYNLDGIDYKDENGTVVGAVPEFPKDRFDNVEFVEYNRDSNDEIKSVTVYRDNSSEPEIIAMPEVVTPINFAVIIEVGPRRLECDSKTECHFIFGVY